MGDIFMGRDRCFDAQPWNSVRRLGITLRVLLPDETEHYGDPGTALFMWLATQTASAGAAIESGQSEQEWRAKLGGVVDALPVAYLAARRHPWPMPSLQNR